MTKDKKRKVQWPRTEFEKPSQGTQCGEVVVLMSEMPGYSVVKIFANRRAAERELALVLQGFDEIDNSGTRQPLTPSRIKHWILKSRAAPVSPDGTARFSITTTSLFT